MGIYIENGNKYTGSGVLIIEDYYKKNGQIIPCILVVQNRASGLFSDFGGTYELKHKTIKNTSYYELLEESCNLFNISPKFYNYYVNVNTDKQNEFYRSYVIKINSVSRKYFLHNKRTIDKLHRSGRHIPRYWRETNNISHIPINNINFNSLNQRGTINLTDIDGNLIPISGRLKRILYNGHNVILNVSNQQPVARKRNLKIDNSNSFLKNTYTFIV